MAGGRAKINNKPRPKKKKKQKVATGGRAKKRTNTRIA